jgi:hypothetical protein
MRRGLICVIVLAVCSGAGAQNATPPPETVLVESGALDGVWSIQAPSEMSLDLTHAAHFGPLTKKLCRFEGKKDNITVRCFGSQYYAREGAAQVDGNKVHLAFGNALIRFVIDATRDTSFHFGGTFAFKFMGIRHDDPETVTGEKIHLSTVVIDSAGDGALLTRSLQELADGALVGPHDDKAIRNNFGGAKAVTPDELRTLGTIQTVRYLGKTAKEANGKSPDFFSVYQVEFASGERLCGLHRREDGVLDGLICV